MEFLEEMNYFFQNYGDQTAEIKKLSPISAAFLPHICAIRLLLFQKQSGNSLMAFRCWVVRYMACVQFRKEFCNFLKHCNTLARPACVPTATNLLFSL